MSTSTAQEYLGGPGYFRQMRKAGLIKPLKKSHRRAIYDRRALDDAVDRMAVQGWPEEEES